MPRVTLSFDNGPDPEVTPHVLDVLAQRGLKTCFFVIGNKLADPARRVLAERARDEGHWIGNHTWTHGTPLGDLDDEAQSVEEIARTQTEIGGLAHARRWFRPFGGGGRIGPWLLSAAARDHLLADRFSLVLWNSIPRDWELHDEWPARALADCRSQEHTLVVLHDHVAPAVRHLDRFLGTLTDAGFEVCQEFPDSCVPVDKGRARVPLDDYVR